MRHGFPGSERKIDAATSANHTDIGAPNSNRTSCKDFMQPSCTESYNARRMTPSDDARRVLTRLKAGSKPIVEAGDSFGTFDWFGSSGSFMAFEWFCGFKRLERAEYRLNGPNGPNDPNA